MKYAIERKEPVFKPKEWSEGRDIRLGELRVVER